LHLELETKLEKGELKAQGTFDELTHANDRFRAMAAHH